MDRMVKVSLRNDTKARNALVSATGRPVHLDPGETRTMLLPLDQAEWLQAHSKGTLTVLEIKR